MIGLDNLTTGVAGLVVFLFLMVAIPVKAQVKRDLLQKNISSKDLQQIIIKDNSWIPYPTYDQREAWKDLTEPVHVDLIRRGEKYIDFEWRVVKATDYLAYERTGSRVMMERPFGQNSTALSSLVLAELAEGEGRFMDQIVNGVWVFCEMTSWALSAHLPGPQKSGRSLPDFTEHVIDLAAGDIGSLLSWIFYFFKDSFDEINPQISVRLKSTLQTRILDTYMERNDFWWQAIDLKEGEMVNNWNPWCNFNVLTSFLLVEKDSEKLAAGVEKTLVSVDQFINYYHEDGACEEGPSYWGHAAGKMYDYLQLLSYATGSEVDIFHEPLISKMGEYISNSYVGDGWVVNFADASAKGGGDYSLIYRYGEAVNSEEMKAFAAYLYGVSSGGLRMNYGRDLFRAMESLRSFEGLTEVEPALPDFTFAWYPETEFLYMKNRGGMFFATKGGYNNESHNHNDIGTFSLYVDQKPVFIDVGVGTYTRETFSSKRYTIWTMQSGYHNLPAINGFDQKHGGEFRSSDMVFDSVLMKLSLDIANAYPSESDIRSWKRSYQLKDDALIIEDDFELNSSHEPNRLNFMTRTKPNVSEPGKAVWVSGENEIVMHYSSEKFDVKAEPIELDDPRLSNVWGDQIFRFMLTEKQQQKRGKYNFRIERR